LDKFKEISMTMKFRKTLIAGAIAALTAGTAWAADPPKYGSDAPATTGTEQPARNDASPPRESQPMGQSMDRQTQRSDESGPASARKGIYTRSADSLTGTEVVDGTGEKIGKVKQIVLSSDRKSAHAVISEGGLLGMGAREVRVSLDQLTPIDDKLEWRVTKQQIEVMEEHTPGQFVELKGDAPISGEITEFSAFEPMKEVDQQPQAAPSVRPETSTSDEAIPETTPK
jgi:sporulation protein YlmC with PRC-barrel domain